LEKKLNIFGPKEPLPNGSFVWAKVSVASPTVAPILPLRQKKNRRFGDKSAKKNNAGQLASDEP